VNGVISKLAARRAASAGMAVLVAGAALTGTAVASAASGHASPAMTARIIRPAVVVQEHRRPPFGLILTTVRGRALYFIPSNVCNASCRAIWPPLLMPIGKNKPLGAKCLGVVRFGRTRLQVTYRGKRLWTFVSDTGTRVTGNGVAGFRVAKVVAPC
jgi:predicted lipoprotein with Yx(FWY)xxD motif